MADLKNLLPGSNDSSKFVVYKKRWYMLAVVVLFNLSNAMIWLTFAPVANFSASYFHISETTVNYFSVVFFIVFIPCCMVSWWTIENFGFRFSVICGTCINAFGAIIRILGAYLVTNPKYKFIVVLIGQIIAATSQPLVLSMPTKLAALWFGDNERTIANTIASMANPLGALLANAFATVIVHKVTDVSDMILVFGIPAVVAACMAVFGFHSSKPPTPPSASALAEPTSFFTGFYQIIRNKSFLLLTIVTGAGIGIFSTISTIIQQLICPQGYNDVIASICGALLIVFGFVGSAVTSIYVDKTRNYIHISKVFSLLVGLSAGLIIISTSIRDHPVFLVFSFSFLGFSALSLLPVMLELGVECTYPVDEATSAGMQWAVGQILGAIMLLSSLATSPELSEERQKHSSCILNTGSNDLQPVDMRYPNIVMCLACTACVIIYVMFFDTKYNRLIAEQEAEAVNTTEQNVP